MWGYIWFIHATTVGKGNCITYSKDCVKVTW